jgi:hypothetical protein
MALTYHIEIMTRERKALAAKNDQVQNELQTSKQDVDLLVKALTAKMRTESKLRLEIINLKKSQSAQIKTLQDLEEARGALQNMTLHPDDSRIVTDKDVCTAFNGLRSLIQRLLVVAGVRLNPEVIETYPAFEDLTIADVTMRFESLIFGTIFNNLLGLCTYGVTVETESGSFDATLGAFEKLLWEDKGESYAAHMQGNNLTEPKKTVPLKSIGDWRVATLNCVSKLSSNRSTCPYTWYLGRLEGSLTALMKPFTNSVDPGTLREIDAAISAVCKQAISLQMMTRESRERYGFQGHRILSATSAQYEAHAVEEAVERGETSEEIDGDSKYVRFGALVKFDIDGKYYVLEKARVVLKRRVV